jgi:hypothetical protein
MNALDLGRGRAGLDKWVQVARIEPNLSRRAGEVAQALAGAANDQTGICRMTWAELAAALGKSEQSLRAPVKELCASGLLMVTPGDGYRPPIYEFRGVKA